MKNEKLIDLVRNEINTDRERSVWGKGVQRYALVLLDDLQALADNADLLLLSRSPLLGLLLRGTRDWDDWYRRGNDNALPFDVDGTLAALAYDRIVDLARDIQRTRRVVRVEVRGKYTSDRTTTVVVQSGLYHPTITLDAYWRAVRRLGLIGGDYIETTGGETIDVLNPHWSEIVALIN